MKKHPVQASSRVFPPTRNLVRSSIYNYFPARYPSRGCESEHMALSCYAASATGLNIAELMSIAILSDRCHAANGARTALSQAREYTALFHARGKNDQEPVNLGGRFSRKAVMPSTASFVLKRRDCSAATRSSGADELRRSFAAARASGAREMSFSASS